MRRWAAMASCRCTEAYRSAREAAQKAIDLDETLAEAHTSLAAIAGDYDWDWTKVDRHFKRAVTLDPNYGTALRFYSFYLACMGRHEEALGFAERARDLDPVSPRPGRPGRGPLFRPSIRRGPPRRSKRRSSSIRTSAMPTSCWGESRSPRAARSSRRAPRARQGSPGSPAWCPYPLRLHARQGRTPREALAALEELRRIPSLGTHRPFAPRW